MITLHHLEHSRSQRIIWLLETLNLDYQIKLYKRDPATYLAPESLKKIHPLGKSPVITDGEQVIAESGFIIEYLVKNYGQKLPTLSSEEAETANYWLHYGEGSLMPFLVMSLVMDKVRTAPMPFFVRPIAKAIVGNVMSSFLTPNIKNHLAYVDQYLADKQWFAGNHLSAADFLMIFPLEAAMARAKNTDQLTHIKRYVKQVHDLNEYKTALEKGGPYNYA